jgi:hypothetical protein
MSRVVGLRCDSCKTLDDTSDQFPPSGWMTVKIHLRDSANDEMHVCSNMCLERIGRERKKAEKEILLNG